MMSPASSGRAFSSRAPASSASEARGPPSVSRPAARRLRSPRFPVSGAGSSSGGGRSRLSAEGRHDPRGVVLGFFEAEGLEDGVACALVHVDGLDVFEPEPAGAVSWADRRIPHPFRGRVDVINDLAAFDREVVGLEEVFFDGGRHHSQPLEDSIHLGVDVVVFERQRPARKFPWGIGAGANEKKPAVAFEDCRHVDVLSHVVFIACVWRMLKRRIRRDAGRAVIASSVSVSQRPAAGGTSPVQSHTE